MRTARQRWAQHGGSARLAQLFKGVAGVLAWVLPQSGFLKPAENLVGVRGFEPPAPASRNLRVANHSGMFAPTTLWNVIVCPKHPM